MRLLNALLLIAATLVFFSSSVLASDFPPGNYWQSCRNCRLVGLHREALVCGCQTKRGVYTRSFLRGLRRCNFVQNFNGQLTCTKFKSYALPKGNYGKTCRNCHMAGLHRGRLVCKCQTTQGFFVRTVLDRARRCEYIQNLNGQLTCSGGRSKPLPAGNYRKTCKHCRYRGRWLRCVCQRRDQSWDRTAISDVHRCRTIINFNGNLRCQYF